MSKDEYYFEAYNDSTRYPPEMNAGRPKHLTAGGRVVYGGGGITPDVWLEEGNHLLSDSVRRLYFIHEQRLFYTFAEDCIHRHPGLRRLTLEQFVNEFQINPSEFEAFKKLVRQEEPSFPEKDFDQNATELKFLLQRDLAYFLWGDEGRFRVNLQRDEQLQQAQALFPQANALLTLNKIDTRADLERRD
jgi:carboxyl-terminal processing protease